ncbi:hypothetical protein ACHAWF_011213 [Thalassiosira exigua]
MTKGKQRGKSTSEGIRQFLVGKPREASNYASPPCRPHSPPDQSSNSGKLTKGGGGKRESDENALDKLFIRKKSPATAAMGTSGATRRLRFDDNPPRKKTKTSIQAPMSQFLKSSGIGQKQRPNFLHQRYPDPSTMLADHRVTEIQFRRDALSIAPAALRPIVIPLNEEQRKVAECPSNIPLSIRAGAGTGKTHTMVQRAVSLVNYGIRPQEILIITFSNKAAQELKERVSCVFSSQISRGEEISLPTIKTFHSLALHWIRLCWPSFLGRYPSILATKSQQRSLMKRAIEENCNRLMMEQCQQMMSTAHKRKIELSWESVLKACRCLHQQIYDEASAKASEKANKSMPGKKKTDKLTAEEQRTLNEERKKIKGQLLRYYVYRGLLQHKNSGKEPISETKRKSPSLKSEVAGDLMRRWSGDSQQCDMYLEMIRKARLGQHQKKDYLIEDARVWEIYDNLQLETGQIDFDKMLSIFTDDVISNEKHARRFHSMYNHIIVDEYQDNSESQALMMNKIVQNGSLTVVGDEDQCIYGFRGASPGNFVRLKEFLKEERHMAIREETLVANHRSGANILEVASTLLQGDTSRYPKALCATKPAGAPVEVWNCSEAKDQATHIVASIMNRHETDGIPYGEMACLFRCFKMGKFGCLHSQLQQELASKHVPFVVVGGSTIFERASVRNLLAYLCLSVRGSTDDESFERVINTPRRRLPAKKVMGQIKERSTSSQNNNKIISFQEAAKILCETEVGLSSSQCKSMKGYFALIDRLQAQVNNKRLPELLEYIWRETGLEDYHRKKMMKDSASTSEDEESDDEKGDSNQSEDNNRLDLFSTSEQENYYPAEVKLLIQVAKAHVEEWEKREKNVLANGKVTVCSRDTEFGEDSTISEDTDCSGWKERLVHRQVSSLVDLTRDVIMKNKNSCDIDKLPEHIQDDIILAPHALGRSVVREFLANVALQNSVEDDKPNTSGDKSGKVSISTIHRSKGLEWEDVYIPYFNEGFMPTTARSQDDEEERGQRHLRNCNAMRGDRCDKSCAEAFQNIDNERLGGNLEERHENEERRLAHVAATRAKTKLAFTTFQHLTWPDFDNPNYSKFMEELGHIPNSVLKVVSKLE